MKCVNHPDRPVFSICQKYDRAYCRECCLCADPKTYCKFRTQCIGWQVCHKEKAKEPIP